MAVARAWPDVFADRTGLRHGPEHRRFATWFNGRAASWRRDGDFVVVSLRDPLHRLEVPLQTAFYAGTGGLDGGIALRGRLKPLTYGSVFNIAPVYLGAVDLGEGLYDTFQVHDGQIEAVDAVRERGAAFVQVSASPLTGEYRVWPELGVFQLGSVPVGSITADVRGDAQPYFVGEVGRIVRRILVGRLGMTDADLDSAAFDRLTYLQPGAAGIHVGTDAALALDVIEALVSGIGGFITGRRDGRITMGRIDPPALPAQLTLEPGMVKSVEELQLPPDLNPPARRRRVGYRRNYFPSTDLIGALTEVERLALAHEYRVAAAFDADVAASHALATDPPPIVTPLYDEEPATVEVQRLLALHTPKRRLIRVRTDRFAGQVQIGHVCALAADAWPRDGLAAGFLGVVVRWSETAPAMALELDLYG